MFSIASVKEHATLSAGARVDHGVKVETTKEHVNRAADRGCCVSSSASDSFADDGLIPIEEPIEGFPTEDTNEHQKGDCE